MRLSQLKKSWTAMSTTEKLELIDQTNERRTEAFEIKIKKRTKTTKKKSSTKRKSRRSTPKTPEGLAKLMADMSPEERENFKLMINMQK